MPVLAQTSMPGATVQGVVRDTITRRPLVGARVQAVSSGSVTSFAQTDVTDSLGRYALHGIPDGRYMIGFFHPVLDSLGVEAPVHEIRVESQHDVQIDLATPTGSQIKAAVCGAQLPHPQGATDSGAVIIGVVRGARDRTPISGAAVSAEWLELTFATTGMTRRVPRLTAVTGENGWFALCNVPSGGNVMLRAGRDADSTSLIDVRVPLDGFLRRELYLGAARTTAMLTGTVTTVDGGRPIVGAQVGISGGPQTHSNDRGEWALVDAPAGTRTLEVRAVAYYPERRTVDVLAGAAPVRVSLSTMKAVLDTVRVTATSLYNRDSNGFLERRRSFGTGRFLNAQEIERRGGSMFTSDALRTLPGVHVDHTASGKTISVNGPFGRCTPEIYVNGLYVPGMDADDIDSWAGPGHVTGIEVYTRPPVPVEFQHAFAGCGSIVIWTR
jgi:hypothetical protein